MPVCLYNLDWRKFPIKLQKYFILMIANMQKPLNYHGFGVVCLDLMTFIAVRYHFKIFFELASTDN